MKLRKALEKAMEAIQEGGELPSEELSPKGGKSDEAVQWMPPVYSESKTVSIPQAYAMENHCIGLNSNAVELENYKVLRTQILQRTQEKGFNTIMVTSVGQGDGKTVTAINLALTFAKEFQQTTMLVDCDLRAQQIHKYLGYQSSKGIGDYLITDEPLSNLIVWPGVDKLTIISGGQRVSESSELLASPKMKNLVMEMKTRYKDRYIFFDMPPLLGRADAAAFTPLVDCVLFVVRFGKTTTRQIREAIKLIPQEKLLGFVMNRTQPF